MDSKRPAKATPEFALNRYRVALGQKLNLAKHDPADFSGQPDGKDAGVKATKKIADDLEHLQARLWAEGKSSVLLVLQAMDTGGKDGVVRTVAGAMNPAGVRVAAFKAPTEEELAHDFLWRIHRHMPARGEITVFNRSHYEDVLIVAVHNWITPEVCTARYDLINSFEALAAERGTRIIKCFLHISRDEQAERLQARIDDPNKRWKFRMGDLAEREKWDDYVGAYERALSATSTELAPWYVVPANRNWYRDWVIASLLRKTLLDINPQFPPAEEDLTGVKIN